jgi:hypothetical protein
MKDATDTSDDIAPHERDLSSVEVRERHEQRIILSTSL